MMARRSLALAVALAAGTQAFVASSSGAAARRVRARAVRADEWIATPRASVEEAQSYYAALLECPPEDVTVHSLSPLVATIAGFASEEECSAVLSLLDVRAHRAAGTRGVFVRKQPWADERTQTEGYRSWKNAWMPEDRLPPALTRRAVQVAELPPAYAERWNLLQYEVGEEYRPHMDTVDGFNLSGRAGGRIATLILYLDEDFEGGATTFPQLDLAIAPKRGTALFFQNVQVPLLSREARAMKSDARATHAGEPVLSGTKHVMTKWFHPLPFKQDLSEPNREQERRLKVPVSD